jgi:DNA polymerase-3 subunit gamma/tau
MLYLGSRQFSNPHEAPGGTLVQQPPNNAQHQQVLYRKWRPRRFEDVVGQEPVTTTLQHVVATGTPAHAYLFSGPRGTGKTSTGRILAKMLNCTPGSDGQLDPECAASYDDGRALDLIELDAASNRGIDEIRDLRENAGYSPALGPYKVYLIDEAHMLTDAAFNALLKTLEEPPPHVIFILATTEPHRIPATISSRCQRFDFRRHTLTDIIGRLNLVGGGEGVTAEEGVYDLIARQVTGSLRDAENLLDQLIAYHGKQLSLENVRSGLGLVVDDRTRTVAHAAITRDLGTGLGAIVAARDDGVSMRPFIREVVSLLRNALLAKAGAGGDLGLSDSDTAALTTLIATVHVSDIVVALSALGGINFQGDAYDSLPVEIAFAALCIHPATDAAPVPQQRQEHDQAPQQQRPAQAPQEQRRPQTQQQQNRVPAQLTSQIGAPQPPKTPPQPAAAQPAAASFAPPDSGDVSSELQALRDRWDEIRGVAKQLNFKAGALLSAAYLKSTEGDQVEVGLRYPNHIEQLLHNENGELLAAVSQAVSQIAGRELRVEPVLWEELNNTGPAPARKSSGGHLVDEAAELGAVVVED